MLSYELVKRVLDILFACLLLPISLLLSVFIIIGIKLTSKGPAIFWSKRVGRHRNCFMMAKFRSMHNNAPLVATPYLKNPELYITNIGAFLRKTKLDEIPQIYNVLRGEMSFVGPRPLADIEDEQGIIKARFDANIYSLRPGITGLAQAYEFRKEAFSEEKKLRKDKLYLKKISFKLDIYILGQTVCKMLRLK
ncbi:MAG: sugar transferase [Nitrospinota bacterium]